MENYGREYEYKIAILRLLDEKLTEEKEYLFDAGDYLDTVRQYTLAEVLTQDMLLALVDGIEVEETEKINGRRICRIRIEYRFSGLSTNVSIH